MSAENKADITAVIGATGTGKSLWIKQRLAARKVARLLVFDPKGEYSGTCDQAPTLRALVKACRGKKWRVSYQPPRGLSVKQRMAAFDVLCDVAFAVGKCTFIAEELSLVTKAGYSPRGWQDLIVVGARDRSVSVIGTTQRPALVDKTFFSNASLVRCGRLNFGSDKKVMADTLDVPVANLSGLLSLQWVERDLSTGALRSETLTY